MSLRLHVLLIGPIPPPFGGVEVHLMGLRDYLQRQGVHCSVINVSRHRQRDRDGLYFPRSAASVLCRTAVLRPTVIHVHVGGGFTKRDLALCAVCGGWPHAASVMTFHGGGFPSSAAGRLAHPRSFAGFALRRLDHVIAVNREIETVFHRYGVSRNRTSVIEPHTILHPEQIPTSEAAMTALDPNMRAFVMSATPLLVAVVHFEPEYLLPLHLDAVEALRSQFPRAGLLILGNGSQRRAVEDEIRTRGLRSHVYVSGDVPHEQCVAGMRVADVVLRLTAYDGDSIAVREALQLGRPVVATAVAPRPSGVTLVQSHTGTCVADAIVETLRADVQPEEDLNGEIHMARILQLYRSLSE